MEQSLFLLIFIYLQRFDCSKVDEFSKFYMKKFVEEVVKSKKYTHNVLLKRFGAIKSETMLLISLNRDCSKFVYKKVWSNQCGF